MIDYDRIEQQLHQTLQCRVHPVAVAFRRTAPPNVPAFQGSEPSSCSFWRLAAEGRTFYTVPGDHYNCPIGSYTHNLALPPDRAPELDQVLGLMTEIGYLSVDEVPAMPRLGEAPEVIVYAPLGATPVEPDVVLVAAKPGRLMLLHEAVRRAGVEAQAPLWGRPTCMALPATQSAGVVSSTGCIGNRTYTDLPDDELYVTMRGRDLAPIVDALKIIVQANRTLADYHRDRRRQLSTQ